MKSFLDLAFLGLATLVAAFPTSESSTNVALPVFEAPHVPVRPASQMSRNIAACGSRPPSGKRGIAYNEPKYTGMFQSRNSKVNWMYNWDSSTPSSTPDTGYAYVPLLHSLRSDHTAKWFSNIDEQVRHFCSYDVMSFNEPDNCQ
jgi:hypothetical protein